MNELNTVDRLGLAILSLDLRVIASQFMHGAINASSRTVTLSLPTTHNVCCRKYDLHHDD